LCPNLKVEEGLVVYTCNLSPQEGKAGRSQILGQPGLHKEFKTGLGYMARQVSRWGREGDTTHPKKRLRRSLLDEEEEKDFQVDKQHVRVVRALKE
jgi:hypothetical protein